VSDFLESNLKGLQVLLIRPKPALEQEPDSFAGYMLDHNVILHHCPVMKVFPLESPSDVDQIKAHILDFAHYDRAIFISRTAAKLAMVWLERYCASVPEGLPIGMRYYAVGKSTAAELKEWGVEAELPDQAFSSEGLLALPSLQQVSEEKVAIFCGEGGRSMLADQLGQRGAIVRRCELYRREITHKYDEEINHLLSSAGLELVIAHSGELLSNLIALVEKDQQSTLQQLPLLVPSERVAAFAKDAGFNQVFCASSALPEDMASGLRGWYSNKLLQ
jgi:uroporphyrinogen-III synthase